jgi:pimeloyl-ACP methyl ester carboxylesterase
VAEFASLPLLARQHLARGDGHPVLVFPGLASNALATLPLRRFCNALGYRAHDWERGFNIGPRGDTDRWLDGLARSVCEMVERRGGRKATLIGWSLGGFYAREAAKRAPQCVRRVITIGTPFASIDSDTPAARLFRLLNPKAKAPGARQRAELRHPPPVPTTSIYSRSDGVVSWQACRHRGTDPQVEDIEVAGSHCGMGWNPKVLALIAERLARPVASS